MKKYINGITVGIVVGIINCLFLLFSSDIEITVYMSTLITWLITGLFISSVNFKTKGIIVSLLLLCHICYYYFKYTIWGYMDYRRNCFGWSNYWLYN